MAGPYEGGGAGGKFQKKPFRKPTLPYERPPTAIRNPIQAAKNVFVSKVVDPASRIIAKSAQSLFSSLFRKRLTAPPLPPEATLQARTEVQQASTVIQTPDSATQKRVSDDCENQARGGSNNGINEIEEVLKQKTFTKAEIDHLTELLRSRTVALPAVNTKTRSEQTTIHDFQVHSNFSVQGNKIESQRLLRGISATAVNSSVLEADVASPAELAQAYMGSTPLKISTSNQGLHGQAFREDMPLSTNFSKSTSVSLTPRLSAGLSENGYAMSRSRGRSAIYSMARTPNSRGHDSPIPKINGNVASSSSHWSLENNTHYSRKQALKRRSSILDNDIGSVGPIRRIRQKTNIMPPRSPSLPSSRGLLSISENVDGSDIAQGSRSVMQKQMFLNGPKDNISNIGHSDNYDNNAPNSVAVPSRSSEMAEKILQQLDKVAPCPKEKLFELKLAVARKKSPTKLTHSMLHGKALRTFEDIESSKLPNDDTFEDIDGSQLCGAWDLTSHKQSKFDNDDRMLIAASNNNLAPKENGIQIKGSKENMPGVKASGSASFVAPPSQKRSAFRMSAEDFLDLDDDSDNGEVDLATDKEKLDKSVVDTKAIIAETGTSENQFVPSSETKPPTSTIPKEGSDTKDNISTIAEKDGGFSFPITPASSAITQVELPTPQVPMYSNGAAPHKETIKAPIFGIDSENLDKRSPFKHSSKSSITEISGSTFGPPLVPKSTQISSASVSPTVIDTPKVSISDESDSQKRKDLFGRLENNFPSTASASSTMNIFSSGPGANSSKSNDAPLVIHSVSPISAAQVPNGPPEVIFSAATSPSTTFSAPTPSSTVSVTSTSTITNTTVCTTNSNAPIVDAAPTVSAPSLFMFGSNSATFPSHSSSLPVSASGTESTNSALKDKKTSSFGTSTNFQFGAPSSSELKSTSSNIFGFSASTTSNTSNLSVCSTNQSLSSTPFGTSTGSMFGAQGTSVETNSDNASFTNNLPNKFGLSASSSTAAQSVSSSLSSGSSIFGSSPANTFGSSSGFGLSSSTSTGASSLTSNSGTNLFGSSIPSSSPSVFGSPMFGSGMSTGFSFGASSAAAAPASSAPMVFGSSSAPSFPFTPPAATTSASLASPQSVFGTPSPVFGTPSTVIPFGSTPQSNDQMSMEDSMAEDTQQASNPVVPAFGQPANSPSANFSFGSGAIPSVVSTFQFGGQQNLGTPQNPSPFQASGNLEFSAGGSFSLGTGGVDKSNRKYIKPRRDKNRKR